jgi:hypothetical protein
MRIAAIIFLRLLRLWLLWVLLMLGRWLDIFMREHHGFRSIVRNIVSIWIIKMLARNILRHGWVWWVTHHFVDFKCVQAKQFPSLSLYGGVDMRGVWFS